MILITTKMRQSFFPVFIADHHGTPHLQVGRGGCALGAADKQINIFSRYGLIGVVAARSVSRQRVENGLGTWWGIAHAGECFPLYAALSTHRTNPPVLIP